MKKYLTIPLLFLLSISSFAQMGSLAFSLGIPQNEFKETSDAIGFGGDLSFLFPFQEDLPFYVGLDVNYMVYGKDSQNKDLDATLKSGNTVLATIEVPLKVVTLNNMFGTHVFLRAVAPFELVQPYAEALIGFRYLSTNTKITDRSADRRWAVNKDSDVISRKKIVDDWTLSYGFGGGFLIAVADNIFIDLRADYFIGERAKYFDSQDTKSWDITFTESALTKKTITGDDLTIDTKLKHSTTDMLVIKFGIAGKF